MKYNVLFALTAFFITINSAWAEQPPMPPAPHMITVTGEAREEVTPDQAVLSGQLISKAKQLSAAKEANDKLANRILAIAKQFDIPKEKIAASNVSVSPDFVWNQNTQRNDKVGYIISRSLSLTMDKMEVHERVLSALLENNIDQISNVDFRLANPEAHEDQLRVKALQNAHARAQMLAEAAGAKLGKVVFISTGNASMQPMPIMARAMPMAAMAARSESVAPSLPGMIQLQETITATYELEQ